VQCTYRLIQTKAVFVAPHKVGVGKRPVPTSGDPQILRIERSARAQDALLAQAVQQAVVGVHGAVQQAAARDQAQQVVQRQRPPPPAGPLRILRTR